MSAFKSREGTDKVPLRGSITLPILLPILSELARAARLKPGTCFQLDCSEVTGISLQALAELVKLRRDVRGCGCELILTNCGLPLTSSPLFRSLLQDKLAVKQAVKSFALQGPHAAFQAKWKPRPARKKGQPREPYFLRLHGTRYQRFWLN
jgi:hypothetical protein